MLSVTVLMDNSPSANRALLSGHGLSILVEGNGCRILFDCGPDDRFMQNARKLGIPLSGLDAAVLSHGHYDHAAGLRDLAEEGTASFPPLYVGRGFFRKKHSRSGLRFSDLSPGWTRQDAASWGFSIHEAGGCLEIAPGIFLIQGFPRMHAEETIPGRFVLLEDGRVLPDSFSDEIVLAVRTDGGLVLIAGCSHPGILNIVDHAGSLLGHVHAVIGGIHLADSDAARISHTISELHSRVDVLALCHCSGDRARKESDAVFGLHSASLGTGDTLFF